MKKHKTGQKYEDFKLVMCQIWSQPKFCNNGFIFTESYVPQELNISLLAVINNITFYIQLYQIHHQYANYYLLLILPKKQQHADLSLVLSWSGPPVPPQRVPGRLLMHFTTSTHTWVCTRTHTEGCLQYASKPPSRLPNAKCLPNKYRDKCINTHIMTCSLFPCIFHWNPPTFTHSLTINKQGIQVSDCALAQIRLIVYQLCCMECNPFYITHTIIFFYFDWLGAFTLALYYIPHAPFTPGQIPPPVCSDPGPLYFVRCCWPCRWEGNREETLQVWALKW